MLLKQFLLQLHVLRSLCSRLVGFLQSECHITHVGYHCAVLKLITQPYSGFTNLPTLLGF